MSHHGCPERLSNRSKGFQEDGQSQPTMEVLVETLTGTAFEMTVSPTDTVFTIKSKIFRVEGIPVAQQHLLYNLKELDDASSLRDHHIADGARLRLVLGMRGGPVSTRRLPPPPSSEPWRDIEKFLDSHRDDSDWASGSSGCKVTVVVFRDNERVNMLRLRENKDGSYSPLKYSSSLGQLPAGGGAGGAAGSSPGAAGSLQDNALTMCKMAELRRRMRALTVRTHHADQPEIQKTRSEETLSVPSLLDDSNLEPFQHYTPYSDADDSFTSLYDGNYTRYDYDCSFNDRYTLLPPIGARTSSDESVQDAGADSERIKLADALAGSILVNNGLREGKDEASLLEECLEGVQDAPLSAARGGGLVAGGRWGGRSSLARGLFSSSTSELDTLKRNTRILPALSRHRNREHLHLSDEGLDLPNPTPPRNLEVGSERRQRRIEKIAEMENSRIYQKKEEEKVKEVKVRIRCGFCKKRLSIATVHKCRCGAEFCAPHRYAEVHGCAYDYKANAHQYLQRANPLVSAPKLPKI